jgi:predicted lipoprotein with Yx(FWY)xxD motif
MKRTRTYASLLALAVAALLIVAACGGSSDSGTEAGATGSANAPRTVSVESVDDVGDVLVDADGDALYAADQEVGGMVRCIDGCTTIWEPLTVGAGETPSAGDGLGSMLGVVQRPDGDRQVTLDGRLLYSFVEDPSPGTVTGNGFADEFQGRLFTWHVATPTGISTTSANSGSSSGDPYGG